MDLTLKVLGRQTLALETSSTKLENELNLAQGEVKDLQVVFAGSQLIIGDLTQIVEQSEGIIGDLRQNVEQYSNQIRMLKGQNEDLLKQNVSALETQEVFSST